MATAAFVFVGVGNALDAPEPGSVYEKENALGIVLVIGQTLPLLIAFRLPVIALTVVMVSFVVHTGLDHEVIWIVQFTAFIAGFMGITQGGNRQSLLVLLIIYVGVVLAFGIFSEGDRAGNVVVQFLLFGGLWVIGTLFRTRRIRLESTEHVLANLEAEQDRLAREAVQEERVRIARDLHDIVGHTLNLIVVQAGAAQAVFKSRPDQALESLEAIETISRQSLSDMERMLGILRPSDGDGDSYGVHSSLEEVDRLAKQFTEAGLPVKVNVKGAPRKLPPSLDLSAYRIVQEALTNTLKHAGTAKAAVAISYLEDKIEVDIIDDGNSSGETESGSIGGRGLIGMKERVALFGGTLEVGPAADGGFRVHASLPLENVH